jgi:ketosteroid isomerase-like protein
MNNDLKKLSALNALFIRNFVGQDTVTHDEIIHKDFVCVESNGQIVDRKQYMLNWHTDYERSKFKSFTYTDEHIRVFGNMALVRSKTEYTRVANGKEVQGHAIYTDTYIKEKDRWWCVQAQITPIK